VCFEPNALPFPDDLPFGEGFPFEWEDEIPLGEGLPFEDGFPFEFEFEWEDEFPFGDEFFLDEGLPFEHGEGLVGLIEEETEALADHLEEAGIEYERRSGLLGIEWIVWDITDPVANEAVEEFFTERSGHLEFLPPEGLPEGIEPEDLPGLLDEHGDLFDDLPEGILEMLELLPPIEMLPFDEGPFLEGPAELCMAPPGVRAERLADEAAELAAALRAAGVEVGTETIEIEVPVWDADDDVARDVVEEFYADRHGALHFEWEFHDDHLDDAAQTL
jgi:hypothetical protein